MTDFVSNDTGSTLLVTCTDKVTGHVIDLTGSLVTIRWYAVDGSTVVSKAMSIVNAAAGKAKYQFLTGELFSPIMRFEVAITSADGAVITNLDLITATVRNQID